MMEEQEQVEEKEVLEEQEIPAGLPMFYADGVGTAMALYGLTLVFQRSRPRTLGTGGAPREHERIPVCTVQMSPELAKALSVILVQAIRNYEKEQGIQIAIDPARQEIMEELYGG